MVSRDSCHICLRECYFITMNSNKFALKWDLFNKNVCNGLSTLQQSGEFVDMTLAADGHLVKVHKIVMALASPYIKDMISSVESPHPVIFLTNISHDILNLILEYIYTGEVIVPGDKVGKLLEVAKELHIQGLENMEMSQNIRLNQSPESRKQDNTVFNNFGINNIVETDNNTDTKLSNEDVWIANDSDDGINDDSNDFTPTSITAKGITDFPKDAGQIHYTVSNQGNLQMILNRYVYFLKYTNRMNCRQWRCIDYLKPHYKCKAIVNTKDDRVTKRISAHTHSFHDSTIMKKARIGSIFTAIKDAENVGNSVRLKKEFRRERESLKPAFVNVEIDDCLSTAQHDKDNVDDAKQHKNDVTSQIQDNDTTNPDSDNEHDST